VNRALRNSKDVTRVMDLNVYNARKDLFKPMESVLYHVLMLNIVHLVL